MLIVWNINTVSGCNKLLQSEVTNMQNNVTTNYKILTDDARESAETG